jgi:hypothetical protein
LPHGTLEFRHRKCERPVSGQQDNRPLRVCHTRPHRSTDSPADYATPSTSEPVAGVPIA